MIDNSMQKILDKNESDHEDIYQSHDKVENNLNENSLKYDL